MTTAIVIDSRGERHALEALEGWRLMEIIRDWGIPIGCECGGAASCGMCHVEVAPNWIGRLPPRSAEEEDKLDELPVVTSNTRLACQIIWHDRLDGLEVTLPDPDR
jgi:2Fe-2S ferredoxin